jgi:hypothetical protein
MPTVLLPDEVREKYTKAMPGQLGEAVTDLFHHTAQLFSKWQTSEALYGTQDAVDLLNATSGQFFREVQLMLRESIFLHICRLTDPPKIGPYGTLSLRSVPGLLPPTVDATFRTSLEAAIDQAVTKSQFARIWRDNMIAHTALPAAAGGKSIVIPDVSRPEQAAAIDGIGAAMNCIEQKFLGREIAWAMAFTDATGPASLKHYLQKGLEAQHKEDGIHPLSDESEPTK